jgi:hypothetical protein
VLLLLGLAREELLEVQVRMLKTTKTTMTKKKTTTMMKQDENETLHLCCDVQGFENDREDEG